MTHGIAIRKRVLTKRYTSITLDLVSYTILKSASICFHLSYKLWPDTFTSTLLELKRRSENTFNPSIPVNCQPRISLPTVAGMTAPKLNDSPVKGVSIIHTQTQSIAKSVYMNQKLFDSMVHDLEAVRDTNG